MSRPSGPGVGLMVRRAALSAGLRHSSCDRYRRMPRKSPPLPTGLPPVSTSLGMAGEIRPVEVCLLDFNGPFTRQPQPRHGFGAPKETRKPTLAVIRRCGRDVAIAPASSHKCPGAHFSRLLGRVAGAPLICGSLRKPILADFVQIPRYSERFFDCWFAKANFELLKIVF